MLLDGPVHGILSLEFPDSFSFGSKHGTRRRDGVPGDCFRRLLSCLVGASGELCVLRLWAGADTRMFLELSGR